MRKLLLFVVSAVCSFAQSIVVTAPTASESLSGFVYNFASACTTCPSEYSVDYLVDGASQGIAYRTSGFKFEWNTFSFGNGAHVVKAIAWDALHVTPIATSSEVAFTIANTALYADGTSHNMQPTVSPSTACCTGWAGTITLTVSGTGTWTTGKGLFVWCVFVDGKQTTIVTTADGTSPAAAPTLDTTRFYDTDPHLVNVVAFQGMGGDQLCGKTRGTMMGQWQRSVTFANGSGVTVEARASAQEVFLAAAGTYNVSATLYKADGSTGACTPTGYNSDNTLVATVSAGVITAVADGTARVTTTCTGGKTATTWVFVQPTNAVYHFGRNGAVLSSYSATNSIWSAGMFNQVGASVASEFTQIGLNTLDLALSGCGPPGSITSQTCTSVEATWKANQDSYVSTALAAAVAGGYYVHLIGDSWFRLDDTAVIQTTVGTGSTWTPPAFQYALQSWGTKNSTCTPSATEKCYGSATVVTLFDEVNSRWGAHPLVTNLTIGQDGFTQIVATSNVCVGTWTNQDWPAVGTNAKHHFVIRGAGTTALNSTTGNVYEVDSLDATTFTFNCSGVANGTYNSSNNASLVLERYAQQWVGGLYALNTAFAGTVAGWINTASPVAPCSTWANQAATNATALYQWQGNTTMACFAEQYYPGPNEASQGAYADHAPAYTLISNMADFYRARLAYNVPSRPWTALTGATVATYVQYGYPVAVTGRSADTITTSTPHGLYNVYPGTTRLLTSGGAKYYVRDAPTASTLRVVVTPSATVTMACPPPAICNDGAVVATATFDNAVTVDFHTVTGGTSPRGATFNTPALDPCPLVALQGHTFTLTVVSGQSATWEGKTYFYPTSNPTAPCGIGAVNTFFEVPTGSSSGGTISITPSNYYQLGRSQGDQNYPANGPPFGPRYAYAGNMVGILLRAAGTHIYSQGEDPQGFNFATGIWSTKANSLNVLFDDNMGAVEQQGALASSNFGTTQTSWYGLAIPNLLAQRYVCYVTGTPQPTPDYGDGWQSAARAGTCGNLLIVQSFWDAPRSLTVNLAPYLVSGQAIWRLLCAPLTGCALTQITAGTTSDAVSFDPTGTVWYIFANSASTEIVRPSFSARLADVATAAKIVVEYAYTAFPMSSPTGYAKVLSADMGTGSGTLPVDPGVGTVYYRINYLASSGAPLAQSGVQWLPRMIP